jgi:hypothetical protein
MKHSFTKHPGVASKMVYFVMRQNATSSNAKGKVEILKKEVKQLTKESRTRAKKLDSRLKTLEAKK